jgi:probable addiction module antidote protein
MTITVTDFDPSAYLDNKEVITEYLSQIMEEGSTDELLAAIGDVARARGMAHIAHTAGMGRESLYKALSPGAKPRFDTVMKVLRAMDIKLHAFPV